MAGAFTGRGLGVSSTLGGSWQSLTNVWLWAVPSNCIPDLQASGFCFSQTELRHLCQSWIALWKKDVSLVSNDRSIFAYFLNCSACPLPQGLFLNTTFCLHPSSSILACLAFPGICLHFHSCCNLTASGGIIWSCRVQVYIHQLVHPVWSKVRKQR